MSQTWGTIDTGAGQDTVEEAINGMLTRLDTLRSGWSGTTAPSGGVVGQLFIDTDDTKFYFLKSTGPDVWEKFLTGTAAVAEGGTGATTAADARTNLGLGTASTVDTGTGSSQVPLTSQADARYAQISNNLSEMTAATVRTNLGLGALATLGSVGTSQIDNLSVTTGKIADLGVTGAKIANSTIAISKLENFAATSVLGSDASGVPTVYGLGTLQGSRVLIASQDASASSSIDFTTNIDATYNRYEIQIDGILPTVTTGVDLWLRVSQNAGVSWLSGASDYRWVASNLMGGAAVVSQTSDTDSKVVININETNCRLGSGSGKNANFSIFFMNPASTTLTKTCSWDGNLVSSNNKQGMVRGSGSATGFATAINGLRLLLSSGTIASGNFRLFGLK